MRLVLASHNAKKLKELQDLLKALPLELVSSAQLDITEPEEPHVSFLENALAKARHASRISGLPALADDSGLCVRALGGAPGVASAHYARLSEAPVPADSTAAVGVSPREALRQRQDAANNAKLLQTLAELGPGTPRAAAFVCALVALRHAEDPEPLVAVGRWEGVIADSAWGTGGFGYDPLMLIPELGARVAELGAARKNHESHRAKAARLLLPLVRSAWGVG